MNRRDFLTGGFFAAAMTATNGCAIFKGGAGTDTAKTVFISDVHVRPEGFQLERFVRVVDAILAMRPLPKNVVCFGDVAWVYGKREDYETSAKVFRRLTDAGIGLTLGMGNHDRRGNFLAVWPEYAARTLVPGRIVTRTDLGSCDLLMLDTLWEDHADETKMCKVNGQMSAEQWAWLKAELPNLKRPTLLGAHHPVNEIEDGVKWAELKDLLMASPNAIGWIHGHDHAWKRGLLRCSTAAWGDNGFKRWLCLPSTGHWGDIGYVTATTAPGMLRAEMTELDHYYPNPSKRTWIDDEYVRENNGASMTFRWR